MSGIETNHRIIPRRVSLMRVLFSRTRGKLVVDVNVREDHVHSNMYDFGNEYLYVATAFILFNQRRW